MRDKLRQFFEKGMSRTFAGVNLQGDTSKESLRLAAGTGGNAVTEFALVLPLFVLMMCATVDMAQLFYAESTLQNAVRAGGRYAITGNHQPNPQNPGQNLSRVNSIILVAQQAAMGMNVSNIQVSSLAG